MQIFYGRAFASKTKIDGKDVLGNPASVIICENDLPSEEEMSKIAIKQSQPITTFIKRRKENEFDIRYYSFSGDEFKICGHGSLVASLILNNLYNLKNKIIFYPKSNNNFKITSWLEKDVYYIQLPILQNKSIDKKDKLVLDLCTSLSLNQDEIIYIGKCDELGDLILHIKNINNLRNLQPNLNELSKILKKASIRGLAITTESNVKSFDYEVRIFFPHLGINEDLVCGSTNSCIAPYWNKLLKKNNLQALYPFNNFNYKIGGIQIINIDDDKVNLGGYVLRDL